HVAARRQSSYRTPSDCPRPVAESTIPRMSDRLAQLEKMLEKEPTDPFLLYGVAMEHKKAERAADAIEFFERTIAADAGYCYAFYQLGQIYEHLGDEARAKQAYEDGISAARVKGDAHALSELQTALESM